MLETGKHQKHNTDACIAYIANDAGWRAFKSEVHPEDLKNFVRIQKPHDIDGRVFTSVIRGYGWVEYWELYEICKTRIKQECQT